MNEGNQKITLDELQQIAGNKDKMLQILELEGNFLFTLLTPSQKMKSLKFLRDVLHGSKKLLKKINIKGTTKIPRLTKINMASLWTEVKNFPENTIYFPDASVLKHQVPDRNFLLNVS